MGTQIIKLIVKKRGRRIGEEVEKDTRQNETKERKILREGEGQNRENHRGRCRDEMRVRNGHTCILSDNSSIIVSP